MLGKIRKICTLSLRKFIYYNFLSKNVERHNGHLLFTYRHSVISISSGAKLILDADFSLNAGKLKGSKAEAYLVLGDGAILHICGNVSIRYGSTVQVNKGASAEFGHFTCNVGLNIQCNKQITIGDDCMIGRNVTIYDSAYHPTGTNVENMEISQAPVHIGNHVWLGTNSAVMLGTEIGDGAIIGTHATVKGSIASGSFVAPKTDEPAVSGMLWARSMDSLQDALKYGKVYDQPKESQNKEEIPYYRERILKLLRGHMGDLDFEASDHLVDGKILDSLALVTVVSLLMGEFHVDIPYTDVNAYHFNSVNRMAELMARICAGKGPLEQKQSVESIEKIHMEPLELDISETEKPVVQRIFEYASKNPDDIAIIANDKETTYQELVGMIYSVNRWMHQQGIIEGDCVAVQAVHEDLCIACYYAVHLAGAKLVPLEKSASPSRILEIVSETKASMVISLQKDTAEGIRWVDYNDVRAIAYNEINSPEIKIEYPNLDAPCEMVFTTGTTGKSKGVLMTNRHISWYAYSVAKCVEMKKGNRFFITTPLNHAGGLRRTHLSLANGCCVVYMDGLSDLGRYFEYIRKYRVTSLYLPPVAIRILLTRTGNKLSEFKDQIDFVYSSSSPLPVGDCEAMKKMLPDSRLYNAYEASETPGVSAYNYNTDEIQNNCLGAANVGVELGILLEDGTIVTGESPEGQICVRSKMNMKEYYMEPELTASVWRNGWFVSNDLGTMDECGRIYYHGRRGDVINIGGYKIAPTDVEETALLSGMISECICVESLDEYSIPYLKLIVVKDMDKNVDATELLAFLGKRLESYKVPRKVEVADRIEKTFNGKIDRKAYRTY